MSYLDSPEFQEVVEDYDLLKIDGFDEACIGITAHSWQPQLIYSAAMILNNLMADSDMDADEALDYFLYNVVDGLPNRPNAPVIIQDF